MQMEPKLKPCNCGLYHSDTLSTNSVHDSLGLLEELLRHVSVCLVPGPVVTKQAGVEGGRLIRVLPGLVHGEGMTVESTSWSGSW